MLGPRESSNSCLHTGEAENPVATQSMKLDSSLVLIGLMGLEDSWWVVDFQSMLESQRSWSLTSARDNSIHPRGY